MVHDRLGDDSSKCGHAHRQPRRDASAMERKIGAAGTSSHSIPGSRLGGILSDFQFVSSRSDRASWRFDEESCAYRARPTAGLKSESRKFDLAKRAPTGEVVRQFGVLTLKNEWVSQDGPYVGVGRAKRSPSYFDHSVLDGGREQSFLRFPRKIRPDFSAAWPRRAAT